MALSIDRRQKHVSAQRATSASPGASQTVGYYKTTGATLGIQAGAESKALVMMFMTQDALDKFRASKGWTAGADASVAVLKMGANGTIDTVSASADVNAFALTNAGLMVAATIDGTKISKLTL